MGIELSIHEGALDEALAVVEHAIHLKGGDILPQRGELALLYGAYLTFGVEHIDMDALHAEKAVGHGRTRIARGSHKHINLFLLTVVCCLLAIEIPQQTGHETSTHILEGQRRAMIELE